MIAVIGIGTNIGDRAKNINDALRAISHLPKTEIVNVSDVYETEPWGFTEQETFYNACVSVDTELSPNALLGGCLGIEAAFGRERPFKNAPRILDLDLLLYENVETVSEELNLPHPLISERAFVLVPMKDVLTDLIFNGKDYVVDYKNVEKTGVKRVFKINLW